MYVMLSGCVALDQAGSTAVAVNVPDPQLGTDTNPVAPDLTQHARPPAIVPVPLIIESVQRTGTVESQTLDEISGLAISRKQPGVLFALNDSGKPAQLYALSETGANLGHWTVNALNRDWEDMASLRMGGKDYLVIGDTGDNQREHEESSLYLVEEPSLDTPATTILNPTATLRFRYEDGPRNVEAFAINGNTLYLISKEPIGPDGPRSSRLYELQIPEHIDATVLTARHIGNLPLGQTSIESRLAAAIAGVDLNHATALDFDSAGNTAYVLTYRHVIRVVRAENQSWSDAFSQSSERIYAHDLIQAEALAVVPGKSVWFTSEYLAAPLWALPLLAPS